MKFRSPFPILLLFLLTFGLSACLNNGSENNVEITNPDNADFASLTFSKNDSIPYINTAVFTLEANDSDDPLFADLSEMIVNLDSLPYQTRIDSVFPVFKFMSSRSAFLARYNDETATFSDTLPITGKDTVDFTRKMKIHNVSYNGAAEKKYRIKVNVHTVEPELYHWNQLSVDVTPERGYSQNAILIDNTIYFYNNNTAGSSLYVSDDGQNWTNKPLTNLPPYISFKNLCLLNNKLYLLDENNTVYMSGDYADWSEKYTIAEMKLISFLFVLNNRLWAVAEKDGKYKFASTTDGVAWTVGENLPQHFPVADFASLVFMSATNVEKAIVVGGMLTDGAVTDKIWTTENAAYWLQMPAQNSVGKIKGGKLAFYDKKLHLFGGMDENNKLRKKQYNLSPDGGFEWQLPDTTYNKYTELVAPRAYQSVIVKDKQCYVIGGQTENARLYDVWCGRLNRAQFARQ
ncbi:MAG: DUF6242 domain-containing protein [Prevotellaceae bacterium]|jgi:hypothetical protein|nr:DUF6242 domain-containing protein [Prevotellaceae bacterium]